MSSCPGRGLSRRGGSPGGTDPGLSVWGCCVPCDSRSERGWLSPRPLQGGTSDVVLVLHGGPTLNYDFFSKGHIQSSIYFSSVVPVGEEAHSF